MCSKKQKKTKRFERNLPHLFSAQILWQDFCPWFLGTRGLLHLLFLLSLTLLYLFYFAFSIFHNIFNNDAFAAPSQKGMEFDNAHTRVVSI